MTAIEPASDGRGTVVLHGAWGPLAFRAPIHVLRADTRAEVAPLLDRVDAYVADGYYAAGHVSYDAGPPEWRVPYAWFGIYADVDRGVPAGEAAPTGEAAPDTFRGASPLQKDFVGPLEELAGREAFMGGVERVRALIREGDVYQINYTTAFEGPLHAAPETLHAHILERHPVPYAARIAYGDEGPSEDGSDGGGGRTEILSWSPELFFEMDAGRQRIRTRPMKGTSARGLTVAEDAERADWLRADAKSRAENLMIVDLLRNDLSRICTPGSVRVPVLFEVETYGSVLQMTSTVEGDLERAGRAATGKGGGRGGATGSSASVPLADVFSALFPCGSVTGAPKQRAMQRIDQLEGAPRGVYCGAIGYVAPDGSACFNVAIRTALVRDGRLRLGAGAGIVWDSNAAEEYDETLLKTRFLTAPRPPFRLLETMRLENGRVCRLGAHMDRLDASARYFGWDIGVEGIRLAVERVARESARNEAARNEESPSAVRLRLTVGPRGDLDFQVQSLPDGRNVAGKRLAVGLAGVRVEGQSVFLRHKTTHRPEYDRARSVAVDRGWFDALLVNEAGHVTEGSITNLFIRRGERWMTPPVESGLLPGTARAAFMAERHARDGQCVQEVPLTPEDVASADEIVLTNAIVGSAPAEFIHG